MRKFGLKGDAVMMCIWLSRCAETKDLIGKIISLWKSTFLGWSCHHRGIAHCLNWRKVDPISSEIAFDFYKGGDLTRFVDVDTDIGRSEDFIWNVFVQIADALAFLRKHVSSL